jgi:hypothetical protein
MPSSTSAFLYLISSSSIPNFHCATYADISRKRIMACPVQPARNHYFDIFVQRIMELRKLEHGP